jgi:hypothetical protein
MLEQDGIDELFSLPSEHDLEDFEVFGDHKIAIAVPPGTPAELKKRILAAAKSYHLGIKSIDYVLKKYGPYWDLAIELSRNQELLRGILRDVINEIRQTRKWMDKIENKPDKVGLFAAGAALIRLETSFKAAKALIRRGYNFEALGICRLILEQIAWAYSISELEDETVFETNPTKSVAALKRLLPNIGRVYGRLSDEAHILPRLTPRYIRFKEPCPQVVLATTEEGAWSALILLQLADAFSIVAEYIYRELAPAFSHIVKDRNGKYRVNGSRASSQVISHYKSELSSLES